MGTDLMNQCDCRQVANNQTRAKVVPGVSLMTDKQAACLAIWYAHNQGASTTCFASGVTSVRIILSSCTQFALRQYGMGRQACR